MKLACTPIILLSLAFASAVTGLSRSIYPRQSNPISPPLNLNSPSPIAASAHAFRENDALYLYGGETQSTGSPLVEMDDGFYKLDLSIAWNSSDPAWTHFDTSISYQENRTSILRLALSKDGSIVFAGDGGFHYNTRSRDSIFPFIVKTRTWMPLINKSLGDGSVTSMINFEMGAITDSDSGIIYDIKCDNDADCIVSIFDPSNGKRATVKPARAPLTPLVALGNGAFVSARKSIILLQSYGYQLEPTKMFQEYKIADNSLGVLKTTGDLPDPLVDPCIVSAYGGSKLIVLGGANITVYQNSTATPKNHALNKVYMLDVTTLVWTKLADAPLPYFKSSCAMSGDYLVAFGGYNAHGGYNPNNGTVIMNGNPPSILNVKENVWVTEYKPSTSSAAPLKGGAISIYSGVLLLVFAIITVGY